MLRPIIGKEATVSYRISPSHFVDHAQSARCGGTSTMQIKEFEATDLKQCLHLVRGELSPDAVILETRKLRKGGILGWGARDAVCVVAATGITVNESPGGRRTAADAAPRGQARNPVETREAAPVRRQEPPA